MTSEEINKEFYEFVKKCEQSQRCVEELEKKDDEGYQKGLSDAWEMMRKICLSPYEGGMEIDELIECFGKVLLKDILRGNSASEAKAKFDAWKVKKGQIHVGDVVTSPSEREYIVLHISNDDGTKTFTVLEVSTGFVLHFKECYLAKTCKHYDLPWLTEQEQDEQNGV